MDIVLGSMAFRLNNKHKEKIPGSLRRGSKTIAKEKLYKHILSHIRSLEHPRFNIGITTGCETPDVKWSESYRHWNFKPSEFTEDRNKYKHGK